MLRARAFGGHVLPRLRIGRSLAALALPISCGGSPAAPGVPGVDASTDSTFAADDAGGAGDVADAADAAIESEPWSPAWPGGSTGCTTFRLDGGPGQVPASDAGVTAVATDAGVEVRLAVDDTTVYWSDTSADRVMKAPLTGGPAVVVADTGTPRPTAIAVDATYVYWVSVGGQRILRCPKDVSNCIPFVVTAPLSAPVPTRDPTTTGSIAIDSRNVYFNDWYGGRVLACAITGCDNHPTVIASGLYEPYEVAVDCRNVYWLSWVPPVGSQPTTAAQITKCAVGGCGNSPTVLASDPDPGVLVLDSQNTYWRSWAGSNGGTSILKCAIDGCGGKPGVVVASGSAIGANGALGGPLTDGVHVFFYDVVYSTGVGRLFSCPVSGCMGMPAQIASLQYPNDIALGASSFVVASGAQILSIPR